MSSDKRLPAVPTQRAVVAYALMSVTLLAQILFLQRARRLLRESPPLDPLPAVLTGCVVVRLLLPSRPVTLLIAFGAGIGLPSLRSFVSLPLRDYAVSLPAEMGLIEYLPGI